MWGQQILERTKRYAATRRRASVVDLGTQKTLDSDESQEKDRSAAGGSSHGSEGLAPQWGTLEWKTQVCVNDRGIERIRRHPLSVFIVNIGEGARSSDDFSADTGGKDTNRCDSQECGSDRKEGSRGGSGGQGGSSSSVDRDGNGPGGSSRLGGSLTSKDEVAAVNLRHSDSSTGIPGNLNDNHDGGDSSGNSGSTYRACGMHELTTDGADGGGGIVVVGSFEVDLLKYPFPYADSEAEGGREREREGGREGGRERRTKTQIPFHHHLAALLFLDARAAKAATGSFASHSS